MVEFFYGLNRVALAISDVLTKVIGDFDQQSIQCRGRSLDHQLHRSIGHVLDITVYQIAFCNRSHGMPKSDSLDSTGEKHMFSRDL